MAERDPPTVVKLQHGVSGATITTTSTDVKHGPGSLPGQRAVRQIDRGPDYPGKSELNVLSAEVDAIRVYDEANIRRCIMELLQSNPDDGGEAQLDQQVPPGVTFTAVPVEETGFPSWVGGEVDGWDGRVGEARGTADWVVPADCPDMSCRIVFIHGGLNMWYGGRDPVYRPATARMAQAAKSIHFLLPRTTQSKPSAGCEKRIPELVVRTRLRRSSCSATRVAAVWPSVQQLLPIVLES